jgi:DNA polymerase-3 subunit delta'
MAWQGIEGHDDVARAFITAAAQSASGNTAKPAAGANTSGRVAGSYLFVGPPGVGKRTFAVRLARSLACQAPGPGLAACGRCSSCAQADAGSHPDIDIVRKPDDRATIPLETFVGDAAHRMREGLCWRLRLEPAVARHKTAIILDADLLAPEGANCLLKTLEEPPDGAVIILVGTSPERQLPTIRSRCRIVRFRPLTVDVLRRILTAEAEAAGDPPDPATIAAAAAAAGGSLARARLLLDPDMAAFRERLVELLTTRPLRGVELAREVTTLVEAAGKEAPPRRARLRLLLEASIECLRAAVRLAAAGERPADAVLARRLADRAPDLDATLADLELTLATLAAIDMNAHLPTLVDGWTALLETPRLRPRDTGLLARF